MFKSMKKLSALLLSLVMVFSLFSGVQVKAASSDQVKLNILATSDLHGRFMPWEYATDSANTTGSFARVATAVKEFRAANPNTILVDNGDTIQDNSGDIFLDGDVNPMILGMNIIGYDTWTLGNHEFNYGIPKLEKVIKQFNGKVLAGNLYKPDGSLFASPYTIIEKGGVKVGIIGMTNPYIVNWDASNLEGYKTTSPIDETKKAIAELKGKVDVIVGVMHVGPEVEHRDDDGADVIAKACPELAAIVAGHLHSAIPEKRVNGVVITEPNFSGDNISNIEITLTKGADGKYTITNRETDVKSSLIPVKGYAPDEEYSKQLQPYHDKAVENSHVVIGKLEGGDLVSAEEVKGIPTAQIQETAMIKLINDVQMYYTGADVSAAAAFSTTANIKAGNITRAGTSAIYKYDNTLYKVEVTGKQLKDYIEWSAKYYNTFKQGDLTISFNETIRSYNYDMFTGVKYEVDISKEPGSRIVNLTKMDGTPVKDTDVLTLAVNNYRYNSQLSKAGIIYKEGDLPKLLEKDVEKGAAVRDLIGRYIVEVKKGLIKPEVDNNWKVIGNTWNPELRAKMVSVINQGILTLPLSADGRTPNVKSLTEADLTKALENLITIVHTNDTHARIKDNVGFAKIATKVKELRKNLPGLLVLDAGDTFHGQTIATINKGESIVDVMNAIGYDAMVPGNHDFNYGQDRLVELKGMAKFPILSANIVKADGTTLLEPYTIKEVNGVKIGIFGLSTPETSYKTHPDNVKGLTFKNPIETAKAMVAELKDKTDIIIALSHLGLDGSSEFTSEMVAQQVSGIDIIVDGHSHTVLNEGKKVNDTLIVQTGEYDNNLGTVNFTYKDGKINIINAKLFNKDDLGSIAADAELLEVVKDVEEENKKVTEVVVGKTDVKLLGERDNVRTGETNLGNLITEAMLKVTGADIAFTNGGGIRASIDVGDITKGEVITVLPFGNYVVVKEVKGSDILAALELGVKDYPKASGGFPHIAGMTFKFDPAKASGSRVFEVKINGVLLDKNKTYKMATNDFTAAGGDNYTMFKLYPILGEYDALDVVLADYIQKYGTANIKVDGRVQATAQTAVVTEPQPTGKVIEYIVKPGDVLWRIAQKYGLTYKQIGEYNKLKNFNLIHVGQKLLIPAN